MTHRQRVEAALNHETPDRCPMQFGFTPEFRARLRAETRYQSMLAGQNIDPDSDNAMERALGQDMLLTLVSWASNYYESDHDYLDEWGIGWRVVHYTTPFGDGFYTEMKDHPLADDAAVASYKAPDPTRPHLYEHAERLISTYKDEYYIVGSTVCTIFETAWALRGMEQLMMDFVADPDLAGAILDIAYNYHLAAAKKLVEMGVDMIWTGDDVGGQHGMLIAPDLWRKILKPRQARFHTELRAINPDIRLAYHSDGNILPIIDDLVEIGLDVLNPVQPACMDPADLKQRYGNRLCFWGTIDEQQTLPFGITDDVIAEVRQRLQTVGTNGGLIIGPTHAVQLDTPMENFWAMMNTIMSSRY